MTQSSFPVEYGSDVYDVTVSLIRDPNPTVQPWQIKQRQSLCLDAKEIYTARRIRAAYEFADGMIYVSISGKDSTYLLHLVRQIYPDTPAVFIDTGLEFPEIREHIKSLDNVIWVKPKIRFAQVIEKYGYPVVSKEQSQFLHEIRTTKSEKLLNTRLNGNKSGRGKVSQKWKYLIDAPFKISHMCCDVMKKEPIKRYEKETGRLGLIGTTIDESQLRLQSYKKHGCNAFGLKRPVSKPISIFSQGDVWAGIKKHGLTYATIYDEGEERTGCYACGFGCHKDSPNRFQKMYHRSPKRWKYCMDVLGYRKVLEFMGLPCGDEIEEQDPQINLFS